MHKPENYPEFISNWYNKLEHNLKNSRKLEMRRYIKKQQINTKKI